MKKYYNKYYLDVKFNKEDPVMLHHTNSKIRRPNKKLNYKKLNPYYIKYKFSLIVYKLNLSNILRINVSSHIYNLER